MLRHALTLTCLLAGTVALTACGGASPVVPASATTDTAATPSEPTPEPVATDDATGNDAEPGILSCAVLLPDDELHNILFVPTGTLTERTYPGSTECKWQYDATGMGANDFFQVILDRNASDVDLWRATKDSESDGESQNVTAIEGIGDESYTWVGQGDYRKLYVRRGDVTLILRFNSNLGALYSPSTMTNFVDRLFGRA